MSFPYARTGLILRLDRTKDGQSSMGIFLGLRGKDSKNRFRNVRKAPSIARPQPT